MQQQCKPTDEEYLIPGPEALMASTMALMTGHVQSTCAAHRAAMAAKIVANLGALSNDPLLSPGFQTLVWSLRTRWQAQGHVAAPGSQMQGLWHSSPEWLQ